MKKKTIKFLLFHRYDFGLKKDMKFLHQVIEIDHSTTAFNNFIDNWVKISKKDNEYINIYKLEDYSPYLFKVAYIDKGNLYTF